MSRPMNTAEAAAMETYQQSLEENKELINLVEQVALNTKQLLSNNVKQSRLAVEQANQEGNQSQQEQAKNLLVEAEERLWSQGGNETGGPEAYQMIYEIAYKDLLGNWRKRNPKKKKKDLANFVARVVYGRLYEMPVSFTPL